MSALFAPFGHPRGATLVVGLGNPLLTDDGVGLRVLAELRGRVADPAVVLEEDTHGGLRLMERMVGYDRAIIVDAIRAGMPPGTLLELGVDDLPTAHSGSSHDATLPTALEVGRRCGASLPAENAIRLVAIEAADVLTFHEGCTPAVEGAVPYAVEYVAMLLGCASWAPPVGLLGHEIRQGLHAEAISPETERPGCPTKGVGDGFG